MAGVRMTACSKCKAEMGFDAETTAQLNEAQIAILATRGCPGCTDEEIAAAKDQKVVLIKKA